jgi:ABC-2 type transport system permease protein
MNGVIPIKRTPLLLVNTLAAPFAFLFFISIVTRGERLGFGVAGGLVLTTLTIGTSLQADVMHFRLDLKFQDMVVASPVRSLTYLFGLALSELVYASPGILTLLAVGIAFNPPTPFTLPIIALTLLLVWALGSSLGFFLATYFRDIRETFAVAPLLSLALSVLPPVYYPIVDLPADVRWLAYLAPTTHASVLVQSALGLTEVTALEWLAGLLVLVGFTAGFIALAALKARWREA